MTPNTFKGNWSFRLDNAKSLLPKKAASRGFDTVHLRKGGDQDRLRLQVREGQRSTNPKVVKRGDTHHHVLDRFKGEAR